MSSSTNELLQRLGTSLDRGLTSDQASSLREHQGLNLVSPPVDCPAWACVLLPCLNHLPSMKAFREIQPDDAEVLRGGKWIRYDATSLVVGDIVRLEAGDRVPADCVLVKQQNANGDGDSTLLVDALAVTGQESLHTYSSTGGTLYWGSLLVQGAGLTVVTAIGGETRVAQLIAARNFPAKPGHPMTADNIHDEEDGVALVGVKASSA